MTVTGVALLPNGNRNVGKVVGEPAVGNGVNTPTVPELTICQSRQKPHLTDHLGELGHTPVWEYQHAHHGQNEEMVEEE